MYDIGSIWGLGCLEGIGFRVLYGLGFRVFRV